ncbi:MAG: tRNA (adenosine(37)-N6)-threonylcarbamoyltransferase complex dimerization subunit type 1 TsaB [bacterium]|nr:tRNA (adenosine(37)-N6)-threonylcarbamoyltransferase complex dimerization subunit type 1 TsaB [bacterium]
MSKDYILFIDTSQANKAVVVLTAGVRQIKKDILSSGDLSARLVPGISRLLKQNGVSAKDLKKITVVKGPGGFTSIRVGVAVANALGYALSLPVEGVPKSIVTGKSSLATSVFRSKKPIRPFYGQEPNITKPKKPLF